MGTSLLSMFLELNSLVDCTKHFEAAAASGINSRNNREFAGLIKDWGKGKYNECPELLVQRLIKLIP